MIEIFKQPPIIAAIIALIGAAIIVPLIKKFYFDAQNRLRVEVRSWNYKTSEALKKLVREPLDAKQKYFGPMRMFVNAHGYMVITITNIGKKKISAVSVMVPDAYLNMVWQIDDAETFLEVKKGQPIGLGDIQPKHSRVIYIWSDVDTSDFNFAWFKHFLRISADELDSVRLRFPMPRYLRKKYEPRLLAAFNITALFIALYLGFIR
jgi:hypothetical protein